MRQSNDMLKNGRHMDDHRNFLLNCKYFFFIEIDVDEPLKVSSKYFQYISHVHFVD